MYASLVSKKVKQSESTVTTRGKARIAEWIESEINRK